VPDGMQGRTLGAVVAAVALSFVLAACGESAASGDEKLYRVDSSGLPLLTLVEHRVARARDMSETVSVSSTLSFADPRAAANNNWHLPHPMAIVLHYHYRGTTNPPVRYAQASRMRLEIRPGVWTPHAFSEVVDGATGWIADYHPYNSVSDYWGEAWWSNTRCVLASPPYPLDVAPTQTLIGPGLAHQLTYAKLAGSTTKAGGRTKVLNLAYPSDGIGTPLFHGRLFVSQKTHLPVWFHARYTVGPMSVGKGRPQIIDTLSVTSSHMHFERTLHIPQPTGCE